MVDPLYDLLAPHLPDTLRSGPETSKYLSRLVSLRLSDLTTTEPQSLAQTSQSNLVSIQALSARSHRTTTTSTDHLSTLRSTLPQLSSAVKSIQSAIPDLDSSAVTFASSYSRSKDESAVNTLGATLLASRRESALLANQANKIQDILELPSLLTAAIASAHSQSTSSATSASGANYTQALDLFAHIKRLQILYPDSQLVASVVSDAGVAMRDMTSNLIASLRSPNIRLAAAIRMIGWLRRVAPELAATDQQSRPGYGAVLGGGQPSSFLSSSAAMVTQDEGHLGALFLVCRLCTFLAMIEALSPLRELADQETASRKGNNDNPSSAPSHARPRQPTRKASSQANAHLAGQQTERYLKRFIEIFREQSFATISMYQQIFPAEDHDLDDYLPDLLHLPPALQTFPLHLVEVFMATLKQYLANVTDPTARESLLMQVLYAANSLGRLGADFSLMIEELDIGDDDSQRGDENGGSEQTQGAEDREGPSKNSEPEWISVVKKHRIQAERLEVLAAGQAKAVPVR